MESSKSFHVFKMKRKKIYLWKFIYFQLEWKNVSVALIDLKITCCEYLFIFLYALIEIENTNTLPINHKSKDNKLSLLYF